ncbi:hypothetical protein NDU88_002003 [Pleurodeles waltl]|uniref:Uncharacterized protein n=1 Tax=Pleurodeles waltl TaxID=8319 RepID=A0AAV7L293_PLEWA|nr:hypothetical protein NDU88_002003 [Pleurodeles waltl]
MVVASYCRPDRWLVTRLRGFTGPIPCRWKGEACRLPIEEEHQELCQALIACSKRFRVGVTRPAGRYAVRSLGADRSSRVRLCGLDCLGPQILPDSESCVKAVEGEVWLLAGS